MLQPSVTFGAGIAYHDKVTFDTVTTIAFHLVP